MRLFNEITIPVVFLLLRQSVRSERTVFFKTGIAGVSTIGPGRFYPGGLPCPSSFHKSRIPRDTFNSRASASMFDTLLSA